jgi:hypothetical protein
MLRIQRSANGRVDRASKRWHQTPAITMKMIGFWHDWKIRRNG